jgi:hypothetical protein
MRGIQCTQSFAAGFAAVKLLYASVVRLLLSATLNSSDRQGRGWSKLLTQSVQIVSCCPGHGKARIMSTSITQKEIAEHYK